MFCLQKAKLCGTVEDCVMSFVRSNVSCIAQNCGGLWVAPSIVDIDKKERRHPFGSLLVPFRKDGEKSNVEAYADRCSTLRRDQNCSC